MSGTYAWIVDRTYCQNLDADDPDTAPLVEDAEGSANGTTGPRNAPAELLARLAKGEGRAWRTLVDIDFDGHAEENRVIHQGRYLDIGDNAGSEDDFGPLFDFSQPDSGCVEIQYQQEDGTWKTL
jgi:hypothetical protein